MWKETRWPQQSQDLETRITLVLVAEIQTSIIISRKIESKETKHKWRSKRKWYPICGVGIGPTSKEWTVWLANWQHNNTAPTLLWDNEERSHYIEWNERPKALDVWQVSNIQDTCLACRTCVLLGSHVSKNAWGSIWPFSDNVVSLERMWLCTLSLKW